MSFPSKISYWLLILIFIVFFLPMIPSFFSGKNIILLISVCLFLLLIYIGILYQFFTTRYIVVDDNLYIKSGFFSYKPIPVSSIKQIVKTRSLISSPAPSFDRIKIKYGKYKEIIISPKEKKEFVNCIKKINPSINNNIV